MQYKICDGASGRLLGVLTHTIPSLDDKMMQQGRYYFYVLDGPLELAARWRPDVEPPRSVEARMAVLARSRWNYDWLELDGISLEQLEKTPGFFFTPSVAYLQACKRID